MNFFILTCLRILKSFGLSNFFIKNNEEIDKLRNEIKDLKYQRDYHYLRIEELVALKKSYKMMEMQNLQLTSSFQISTLVAHGVKNAVNLNIINFFELDRGEDRRKEYARTLSVFFYNIFDYTNRNTISIQEEFDFIDIYCKLYAHLNIKLEFEIDKGINISEFLIPPLLTLNLIDNSINRGFREMNERQGIIRVKCNKEFGKTLITIMDNGIGDGYLKHKAKHIGDLKSGAIGTGVGFQNIKNRIELLKIEQDYKKRIEFYYSDIKSALPYPPFKSGYYVQLSFI